MKNTRIITNAKFEIVSAKQIIMNHEKYTWLDDFQLKTFNVWNNNSILKELIHAYNEVLSVNKKRNY